MFEKDAYSHEASELLKKATVQAKSSDYDAAIDSLLLAYSKMKLSNTEWGFKTYFRVARYHHLAGRFDEALQWLQNLYASVDEYFDGRERMYEQFGYRQKGGFLKVSAHVRLNCKNITADEIDLLVKRQKKIENREKKAAKSKKSTNNKSNDLYIAYLEKCLGASTDGYEAEALVGGEIVEALWPFNKRFQASVYRLAAIPYDPSFEKEADAALVAYAFNGDNWSSVSLQAWRVLFERHRQAIIFFQLQADEPFVPVPQGFPSQHYLGAILLFVLHQWRLPLPLASEQELLAWSGNAPAPMTQQ